MSFENMKSNSRSSFEKLTGELDKLSKKSESYKDDRIWKPELDKASNGYAVIRFLPAPQNEDLPWVRVFNHGFKGPGGWYIENSLTTLGQKDPVSEMNTQLWNSGVESDKDIARQRKRRLSYYSNILVVSDPKNPENEGKVFLYKYGKKIFDKIMEKMQPEFEDETAVNPFDFWNGANFRLKVRKVAGFINYDKSEFEDASPVMDGDDAKLEELWKTQYSLSEFTSPSNFKTYDELKTKLENVLGGNVRFTETAEDANEESFTPEKSEESNSVSEDVDNDDALSYFEKLANES
tara:strand:+ start:1556 stop:2434 length:879 start_codon:yes stop_codon:yes gene_type:complete